MEITLAAANKLLREKKLDEALQIYEILQRKYGANQGVKNLTQWNIEYIKKIKQNNFGLEKIFFDIKRTLNVFEKTLADIYTIENPLALRSKIESYLHHPPKNKLELFRVAFLYCQTFLKGLERISLFEDHVTQSFNLGHFDTEWITAPRIAFLASYPKRIETLTTTLKKSLGIFDFIFVSLNEYETIPDSLRHPAIRIQIQQNNLADNGKFYNWFPGGVCRSYIFTIDDDIDYPDDYSLNLSLAARKFGNQCVVGLHGVLLKKELNSYYNSRFTYNFKNELSVDLVVDILGTGTICYWSETLLLDQTNFSTSRMVDLWFALNCHKNDIPLICLNRESNYLKEQTDHSDVIIETSIYTQDSKANHDVEFNLLFLALSIKSAKMTKNEYLNNHLIKTINSEKNNKINRATIQLAVVRYIQAGYILSEPALAAATTLIDRGHTDYTNGLIPHILERYRQSLHSPELRIDLFPALFMIVTTYEGIAAEHYKLEPDQTYDIEILFCKEKENIAEYLRSNFGKISSAQITFMIFVHFQKNTISDEELLSILNTHALMVDCIIICSRLATSKIHFKKPSFLNNRNSLSNLDKIFNELLGHPLFSQPFSNEKNGEVHEMIEALFENLFSEPQKFRLKIALGLDLNNYVFEDCIRNEYDFKRYYDKGDAAFISFTSANCGESNTKKVYSITTGSLANFRATILEQKNQIENDESKKSIGVCFTSKNPKIDLLYAAILSIANQLDFKVDIYFVDDSSENSEEIRDLLLNVTNHYKSIYQKIRVFYYRNQQSVGTYASRNKFIKYVNELNLLGNYDYISFHDDDDISLPNRFKYQAKLIEASGAVCSRAKNVRILDSNNAVCYENEGEMFGLAPITSLYKPSVFKELGYFDSVISRGDTEFISRVAACYGESSLVAGDVVVMLCNQKVTSLSWSVKLTNPKLIQKYRKSYRSFHSENKNRASELFIDSKPLPRKFNAPIGLVSLNSIEFCMNSKIDFCSIGINDAQFLGSPRSV